jgi:energy-coupling factor transporter ATP-binding protein EcfA2
MADLQRLQELHVIGTCEWFLQSDRYTQWRQSSKSIQKSNFLWIYGKPGSGKSTLAGQIVQDMQSLPGCVVLSVFCKDGEESKNDLESLLRNLVFQLLEKSPQRRLFHQIVQAARLNAKTVRAQSAELLWTMFQRMLEGSGEVCCILDGLDECRNPVRERKSFFSQLTKSFLLRSDTARLVVISRLDPAELGEDISRWECVQIRPSDVRGDIEKFAMSEIRRIRALKGHPKKQHILDVLVDSSNGMILWTALMIKELEERPWDAEGVLKEPPQGLSEIYTVILDRIAKTASVRRIQRVLQLVLAASRPLRLEEFALGLAAMEGLRCHEDYDSLDPTTEGRATVRSSQPLLTIMPDETVELSHSSLRDYLFGAVTQSDIPACRFK